MLYMDERKVTVSNCNTIKKKHKSIHAPYEYFKYEAVEDHDKNKLVASVYEIPPNKENYPYHYHLNNEEVFYIISGKGILKTPDGEKKIKAGDIIYCPANEKSAHKLINTSDKENLVYFECDTNMYPDVTHYPESNKVGILCDDDKNTFYKTDSNVDYFEGE